MNDPDKTRNIARNLFDEALAAQRSGDIDRAIELYTASLSMHPTAEAFTYRGWAHSFLGRYAEAIEDCRRAIEVDPGLGNPYNDIGAYLIELGRTDEAIAWLQKAIQAPRYEARCYPYMNLGRIYLSRGELRRALTFLNRAVELNPEYGPAQKVIDVIERKLN